MRIKRFRSTWGVDPGQNLDHWAKWFPELQKKGYSGVEVKVLLLHPEMDFKRLRQICDQLGFEIAVIAQTSLPSILGPRPPRLNADNHLQRYREIISLVNPLNPAAITFQSGQDDWDIKESIKYFQRTIDIDEDLGVLGRVYHETHRSRSLCAPWVTQCILQAVPRLRLTADFSHWVVVSERLLDPADDDRAMVEAIIPHVYHIHTRIGTTQASQCPEPMHPSFEQERLSFERLWKSILSNHFKRHGHDATITFVPEYGPFPYHPIGSPKAYGEVADEEGQRLQALFDEFAATLVAT
ncbi:hypothetical protein CBS147332_7990 [Penicillium roqueforti]|nr:hypothetical protein CBS147332_7990 [Penicillium roqueforti]KAI3108126.1 hypothetical protein CBS147331_6227 [Penicillium roqueforti]